MNAVDLSAIIFVVLALAWAVYLIPKALKHHDEMASDRLVEGHSDRVRILSRRSRTVSTETVETIETRVADEVPSVEVPSDGAAPAPAAVEEPTPAATAAVTRGSARKAARRRRRVLAVLLLAVAVVAGLAGFAIVPWWSTAIPGGMVLVFLVVARLSVRKANARRRIVTVRSRTVVPASSEAVPPAVVEALDASQPVDAEDLVDLLTEDTVGVPREELEAALAQDGSLWDPLPVTLPTYVNKARAIRTVRTIELTGINSSGHDRADTDLAREATESAQESAQAAKDAAAEQRKVAGA